jgi:hypothetical protein
MEIEEVRKQICKAMLEDIDKEWKNIEEEFEESCMKHFLSWVLLSHGEQVKEECKKIFAKNISPKLPLLEVLSQALDTVYETDLEEAAEAARMPFDDRE